ncbi:MAG: hypothetical protein RIQ79_1591 [Verrucomicrobiota bacterium]|jgi:hypothetical protein
MNETSSVTPSVSGGTIAAWRILLRGAGVLLVLFVFCFWAAKGYNRGWSQNRVPVKHLDPVTEIEFTTYEKRFVPGVDYLVGGSLIGAMLFSATFLGNRRLKIG